MKNLVNWKVYQEYINGKSAEELAEKYSVDVTSIYHSIERAKLVP
jgi:Mor family transcriptional regulator